MLPYSQEEIGGLEHKLGGVDVGVDDYRLLQLFVVDPKENKAFLLEYNVNGFTARGGFPEGVRKIFESFEIIRE
jgi:hypothetical protein